MKNSIKKSNLEPLYALAKQYKVDLPVLGVKGTKRLNALKLRKVLSNFIEQTKNENIPLELGQMQSIYYLEDLGQYIKYANTLHEACQILEQYYQIVHTGIAPKFEINDEYFSVELLYKRSIIKYIRFPAEIFLSAFVKQFSELCGFSVKAKKVEFFHKQQSPLEGFTKVFGCDIKFKQKHNKIYFDKSIYKHPIKNNNSTLAKVYQHKVSYEFNLLEDNFIQSIVSIIEQNLIAKLPTIDEVSTMLYIPKRTIQHKLKGLNTSYKDLCIEVRMQKAKELLKNNGSVDSVSFLVGYQNSSAFCKAFKKLYGKTPSEFNSGL